MDPSVWVAIITTIGTCLVTIAKISSDNKKDREASNKKLSENIDARFDSLDEKFERRDKALLDIMRQSLVTTANQYIARGSITTEELTAFSEIWTSYLEFHGNHGMEVIARKVEKLPIIND